MFGGVELFVQGAEPDAAVVEAGEQVGQVFQGAADVGEAADYEGAAGRDGGERVVELGPVGADTRKSSTSKEVEQWPGGPETYSASSAATGLIGLPGS